MNKRQLFQISIKGKINFFWLMISCYFISKISIILTIIIKYHSEFVNNCIEGRKFTIKIKNALFDG